MKRVLTRSRTASLRLGGVALAALLLGGCMVDQSPGVRGFVLDDKGLDQIKPGSSAEQVVLVLARRPRPRPSAARAITTSRRR